LAPSTEDLASSIVYIFSTRNINVFPPVALLLTAASCSLARKKEYVLFFGSRCPFQDLPNIDTSEALKAKFMSCFPGDEVKDAVPLKVNVRGPTKDRSEIVRAPMSMMASSMTGI
jgi:hypothetical protein